MSARVYLSFTLVPVVWFSALAITTTGHPGGVTAAGGQSVKIQTPSLLEKAQAGDAKAQYQIG